MTDLDTSAIVAIIAISILFSLLFALANAQEALQEARRAVERAESDCRLLSDVDWDAHPDGVEINGHRWHRVRPHLYTTSPPEEWPEAWR